MIKCFRTFFKMNVGELFGEFIVDHRLFSQITIISAIDGQIIDIVNAILST